MQLKLLHTEVKTANVEAQVIYNELQQRLLPNNYVHNNKVYVSGRDAFNDDDTIPIRVATSEDIEKQQLLDLFRKYML